MTRDHSSLAQLSKHNLGGTLEVPMLKATTQDAVSTDRLNLAKDDIRRLCKTFHVDAEMLLSEMMERITTGMNQSMAISWAKETAMQRKRYLLPPKPKAGT